MFTRRAKHTMSTVTRSLWKDAATGIRTTQGRYITYSYTYSFSQICCEDIALDAVKIGMTKYGNFGTEKS